MSDIKIIFGGGGLRPERGFPDHGAVQEGLDVLEAHGIDTIDTARVYGPSETLLGKAGAGNRFIIDTKLPGGFKPGSLAPDELKKNVEISFKELGVNKVNVLYFHAPDKTTSIEDALATANELHKAGAFSKFGLSNYTAEDVERVYGICQSHGYVLPSVYQGNYNPLARKQESILLPTLRRLGISFYAYSPIAGGFLAKTKQQVLDGAGRFKEGSAYRKLYANEGFLNALTTWTDIATDANCSPAELAYRWVRYNSALKREHGDVILVGANGINQLKETLQWVGNGPLDARTCGRIDDFWEKAKDTAPVDNFNG